MKLPKISLTTQIFIGLVLGIALGYAKPEWGVAMRPLSIVFLNLIKSIIAPLIFSTLVIGIAGTGDIRQVGRIGLKSLVYFEIITSFALVIGLAAVNITRPGVGVVLAAPKAAEASLPTSHPETFGDLITHLAPASIIKAMADGDVLQIVVFSVIFALAVTSIGEKAKPMIVWCESLADIMFRFTEFVMKFAPVGVGAAMANTVGHSGLGVLRNLGMLVGTLYGALVVFILLVFLPVALLARVPIRDFINAVKEPATIAFATTSSESALPKAMENMERLGVPRRIVGFVLPTGYSFNLDGTTLYLSLASIFIAQAAGVHMTAGQQVLMMLTLVVTSKGVAGVPRASLVILMGTAASFHLPVEGVLVILGVDELMDMARTAVNVTGNCLATVVVARWERSFRTSEWVAEEAELEEVVGERAIAG
ncbi:MAG TPA: cation:dicarboxylase symporter family transporter [Thermoanaerobaculia bacterium]|nr:cation:dicarboxylase symporter family transporter [Thermoanaerobaculia bacterium]